MTTVEILKAAKARIATPERHARSAYARDASGDACRADSPLAVCWCALGALKSTDAPQSAYDALQEAAAVTFARGVVNVNDELGHGPVMALFDRAIALAEAAQ